MINSLGIPRLILFISFIRNEAVRALIYTAVPFISSATLSRTRRWSFHFFSSSPLYCPSNRCWWKLITSQIVVKYQQLSLSYLTFYLEFPLFNIIHSVYARLTGEKIASKLLQGMYSCLFFFNLLFLDKDILSSMKYHKLGQCFPPIDLCRERDCWDKQSRFENHWHAVHLL